MPVALPSPMQTDAVPAAAEARPGSSGQRLQPALQRYLRALWTQAPALRFAAASPRIAGRTIHLPADRPGASASAAWGWYRAAAAHAAAHLALSPAAFDGRGLPPITRALLALLEDARVEALACRELPGLRRLWAAQHTVRPEDGADFATLMLRLSRCLIDPGHVDPHPWVQKGRRLFFVDAQAQILALRRPDELRWAASVLGNDIGQMRLGFNARLHQPGPDYRDDSQWMWPAEQAQPAQPEMLEAPTAQPAPAPPRSARPGGCLYPEWDRLIARLRKDWCAVFEEPVEPAAPGASAALPPEAQALDRQITRLLRPRGGRAAGRPLQREGETPDIDALLRWRIAQSRREPADDRLYRRPTPQRRRSRLLIVIDQSASSASAWGPPGMARLQAACGVAGLLAQALQGPQVQVAVLGFSSNGRREIVVRQVLDFGEGFGPAGRQRLAALRSAHSTRLGAAVRHGARRLAAQQGGARLDLLFISDGEPYDIDVHDPRYLVADARHAVHSAARQGVRVHCIVLEAAGLATARQVFGERRVGLLKTLAALPALVGRLAL